MTTAAWWLLWASQAGVAALYLAKSRECDRLRERLRAHRDQRYRCACGMLSSNWPGPVRVAGHYHSAAQCHPIEAVDQ